MLTSLIFYLLVTHYINNNYNSNLTLIVAFDANSSIYKYNDNNYDNQNDSTSDIIFSMISILNNPNNGNNSNNDNKNETINNQNNRTTSSNINNNNSNKKYY